MCVKFLWKTPYLEIGCEILPQGVKFFYDLNHISRWQFIACFK